MNFPDDLNPQKQAQILQPCVRAAIDLALNLKQLHWNVQGPNFKPVHEFLDEIIDHARAASDEIAERIVTLGHPAIGQRVSLGNATVPNAEDTFIKDSNTLHYAHTMLESTILTLRSAQQKLADIDPVSEDMIIGILADLEKDHWMVRSHLA
jgi:starvation-inducible DNA-binding protein